MGEMMGSVGFQCNGDGTCAAAYLHRKRAKCSECGGGSFDHTTDAPAEVYCLDCGEDATDLLPATPPKTKEAGDG